MARQRLRLAANLFFAAHLAATPVYAQAVAPSVAVLKFRAGTAGFKNIAVRLATLLRLETGHTVVDENDARRLGGSHIDEQVARCSGEPKCIAQIGQKLAVDQVLLVGVSDLGDMILAFQLVDVRTGKVAARVADSLPKDTELQDSVLDAYLKRLLPPEDFLRWGTLRVGADLPGAQVEVNGKSAGTTPLSPLRLRAPTDVELKVSKAGYQDFTARIKLVADSEVEVHATLAHKPGRTWYQKPWVWAVTGGILLAGVVTVIELRQPAPTSVPVSVHF